MKLLSMIALCGLITTSATAQVGIGTTTPNSTLDVQGSMAAKVTISSATSNTLGSEYNFIYTGTSAATVTLPDATSIAGRMYTIKNASTNSSTLSLNTTSSQTIDGITSHVLSSQYQTVTVVSNGTNWNIMGFGIPSGVYWSQGGNTVGSEKKLGTVDNYDLPLITNNTEYMRISKTGSVGIGASSFDGSNPEKLLVDAGTTGSSAFQNVIVGYGNTNSYAQFNIQNTSSGGQASTDIVATADNGTESTNYVDLGINSGSYSNGASSLLNGANNAYLYNKGQDFVIGNASSSKSIIFFTGGDASSNEKFRINSSGVVLNSAMTFSSAGVSSDILPSASATYNLGSSTKRWNNVYSSNILNVSDARLKENITGVHYGLAEVLKMRPVQYNWRESDERDTKIGFLAQELRHVIPEVVVGDESKETLAVNYTEIIPLLVKAIQEQQQQIEQLKKRVTALENR